MSAPVLSRQRNHPVPSADADASRDGRSIRGVVFGLLLAVPFWLALVGAPTVSHYPVLWETGSNYVGVNVM